jgi:drug/metabolite transporter (DMT)-like permease
MIARPLAGGAITEARMNEPRRPLDAAAGTLMVGLTLLWGLQQVAIKLAAHGATPLTQASLRSALALVLLLAWVAWRRLPLASRDGTAAAGVAAGCLFAGEFFFIYEGLALTTASRMVVFIYLAPVLTALALALALPSERLSAAQWAGVVLAFCGLAAAFADGFAAPGGSWRGDACGVIAALMWAATTVVIRMTALARVSAEKTLAYQLGVSALLLPLAAWWRGEAGITQWDAVVVASLLYQGVIIAFASYLAWFWLLTRYLATRLSVFSFLAPLFGVLFGVLILGEPLTPALLVATACVGAGIALVNRRPAPAEV